MSIEDSPARQKRRRRRMRAEEAYWKSKAGPVEVYRPSRGVGEIPYRPERSEGEPS